MSTESAEQIGFVRWFRKRFPGVLIYAIPNGTKRGWKTALTLKEEGVVAGIPDLHIPEWSLWIEMKRTKGGRISDPQKEMIEYLESIGQTVLVAHGTEEASRKVLKFRSGAS